MYTKEIVPKLDTTLGYLYFIDRDHPLASGNSGRVYLHRHLASIYLGRWLLSNEHVHHKDEDKLNNSKENLAILTAKEHSIIHAKRCPSVGVEIECPSCLEKFITTHSNHKYCSVSCIGKSRIKDPEITKELLEQLKPNHSWSALGRMFGYSDVGIKKRAKALKCNL